MQIKDFTVNDMEQAARFMRENYAQERRVVPILPEIAGWPGLRHFADNGLGVAAFEQGEMIGFLCTFAPREGMFGRMKGNFSPIHAHGAREKERDKIYDRLYQNAAEKWVAQSSLCHAIALYVHDEAAHRIFFDNGFGNRSVDAVRLTTSIHAPATPFQFRQVCVEEAADIARLRDGLIRHMGGSPAFMPPEGSSDAQEIAEGMIDGAHTYFAAYDGASMVAYIKIQRGGENFACDAADMMSISGAFALPEVRGSGVYTALLAFLMDWLRERGFGRCSVDFESFNYTARGFWLKHFTAYTHGVVRRIDERILAEK